MLKYKIDILQALKEKGYSTYRLRKEHIFGESSLQKLRSYNKDINSPLSWNELDKLCNLLDVQPSDLLIFQKEPKEF